MRKIILNIIRPIVIDETDAILNVYADSTCKAILITPRTRQRLIAYVLSRIPGVYMAIDEADEDLVDGQAFSFTPEHRQHIQSLIQQGIEHILLNQDEAPPLSTVGSDPATPSTWFG